MLCEFTVSNHIYCRRIGSGPSLLFIHGSCVDSDFFLETAKLLSQCFTVYLYDRRGYSRSNQINFNDYSIQSQVEDVLSVLNAIDTPCSLVAHSAGCAIATELLSSYSDLIREALLFEPVFIKYISMKDSYQNKIEQIDKYMKQQRYTSALTKFLEIIGPSDNQLCNYTPEQLKRLTKNSMHFIKNEYINFMQYSPNISKLPTEKIYLGLSQSSKDKIFGDVINNLFHSMHCPVISFPGGHNCPQDFPNEFSTILKEIIK